MFDLAKAGQLVQNAVVGFVDLTQNAAQGAGYYATMRLGQSLLLEVGKFLLNVTPAHSAYEFLATKASETPLEAVAQSTVSKLHTEVLSRFKGSTTETIVHAVSSRLLPEKGWTYKGAIADIASYYFIFHALNGLGILIRRQDHERGVIIADAGKVWGFGAEEEEGFVKELSHSLSAIPKLFSDILSYLPFAWSSDTMMTPARSRSASSAAAGERSAAGAASRSDSEPPRDAAASQ